MKRYLQKELTHQLGKKIILLMGPRQVGKTTLAKNLTSDPEYLNYDATSHRKRMLKLEWNRDASSIIFDEIHKMPKWKQWLKGIYDTELKRPFIVTGSAQLDTLRKVGDSLAGRYFQYRLMPLCLKELKLLDQREDKKRLDQLLTLSGFPEPFFNQDVTFYRKWRKTHLDIIIKQDIPQTEEVRRIGDLEYLMEMMRERVGSTISYNSMREDLSTDDKTIKRWLRIFENVYLLFKISPFSKNITQGTKKAPKYYFYDVVRVKDPAARLENFVALSLLKEVYFQNDVYGHELSLHFVRDKNQHEIDFLIADAGKPLIAIEVKTSAQQISPGSKNLAQQLLKINPKLQQYVLVKNLERSYSTPNGVTVVPLSDFLFNLNLGQNS